MIKNFSDDSNNLYFSSNVNSSLSLWHCISYVNSRISDFSGVCSKSPIKKY